ncbi:holo-ACP synthase [Jeotgalibacillus sp. R-1-5s-1]|uniref:holo-ACP synthase n=1 Tax=Jeotgalibacillus sp. R-1-5s-1 TaxID=2555897 RepID=UPI00106C3678|nr:holo-ACP synthase [Jeotgalibacillus sp. R-1-5s-1]TFD98286.1 holo-ACP synthase [Jeotgalibacillus sp. R-1-5s-1]
MIHGIGLDIVEINRLAALYDRQPKIADRVLTQQELQRFEQLTGGRRIEFLAGRFAAKEAFAKALGTGIGKECSFQDIYIEKDERGKPFIHYSGCGKVHVTITHTKEYAAAQVVIENKEETGL